MSCWSFGRLHKHIFYTKNYNILLNIFFSILIQFSVLTLPVLFCLSYFCCQSHGIYLVSALFIYFLSCIWHTNLPCYINKTFKSSKAKTDNWLNACMFVQAHQTCKFSVEAINKRSGSRKMLGQTREEEECTDARW